MRKWRKTLVGLLEIIKKLLSEILF